MRKIISLLLLLLLIVPIITLSSNNSNINKQAYSFIILGNWNSIPYPDSLSSISVNVIYYINQTLLKAYALKINIILPKGLLNTSAGNEITKIFSIYNFQTSGNYLFSFNVTVLNKTLPKTLIFNTTLTLYTVNGEIIYVTNFTLPFYGLPKFNVSILNKELNLGYNNISILISNNGISLYNITINSPYFLKPITIPSLEKNQSIEVSTIAYIPYTQSLVNKFYIIISYFTDYGFVSKSEFEFPLYFNVSNLPFATLRIINSPNNELLSGLNILNFTLVNPSGTTLYNFTVIIFYGNTIHIYNIGILPKYSNKTITMVAFANSSQLIRVFGTFITPLGVENLSLGEFNVLLSSNGPLFLEFFNNTLNVTNQINFNITNVTVFFQNGKHINIPLLLPHQTRTIITNNVTSIVNITYKINNISLYTIEKVLIIPYRYVKFNVYYEISNVTPEATGDIAYLVLYISNEGNTLVTNAFIVVSYPNGTSVTPDFYLISQIFPNETIAVPFTIFTQKNTVFHIKILYYVMNKSYTVIYNVPVNFNYIHRPLPASYLGIIGYYISYPIFGIPAIFFVALIIFLVFILIPSIGFKKKKEKEKAEKKKEEKIKK